MKISIIGAGKVGATVGYALVLKNLCDELVLVNRRQEVAIGEALDLQHAASFTERMVRVRAGVVEDTANSDIVIICASVPMSTSTVSRMELADGNVALFRTLIPPLADLNPGAIFIIASNPVDMLSYITLKVGKLDPRQVIGTGTLVDSGRFRDLLSKEVDIHPSDLRAYILGEHGPNQFPAMSQAQAGGEQIQDNPERRALFEKVVDSGFAVLRHKGYTSYAIATATVMIVESIAYDLHHTFPVSVAIDGYLDIHDVCLSIPVVLGRHGVERVLHPNLNQDESAALRKSATYLRECLARYDF